MKTSALFALIFGAALIRAAEYPAPVENDWVVHDFRFHTGESLPEMRLHYTTVGARTGEPVLILHGTNGTGRAFLRPDFAGEVSRLNELLERLGGLDLSEPFARICFID